MPVLQMYRGGKICLTIHFKPLWAKNRSALEANLPCAALESMAAASIHSSSTRTLLTHALLLVEAQHILHLAVQIPSISVWQQAARVAARTNSHQMPLYAATRLCSPHFGIAHALCLGLGPWLAAEVPHLVDTGVIHHKDAMK